MPATPISTLGVPPIRSRVENENARRCAPSRTWVTSTQSLTSFDRSPIS